MAVRGAIWEDHALPVAYTIFSPVVGMLRTTYALVKVSQHITSRGRYEEIERRCVRASRSNRRVRQYVLYTLPDVARSFWWKQVVRGISEIVFPVIAAIFWIMRDCAYQRPQQRNSVTNPYTPPFGHKGNLLGWDEIEEQCDWENVMNSYRPSRHHALPPSAPRRGGVRRRSRSGRREGALPPISERKNLIPNTPNTKDYLAFGRSVISSST